MINNLPNGWRIEELGKVFDVRDGTHDSPKYLENKGEGFPLITSKNIKDGKLILEDCNYISKNDYEKINQRSKVNINDIIMPMIGTIGNPHLIRIEPIYAIKNVALFKPKKELPKYLIHYLNSNIIKQKFLFDSNGGTQKFVSLKYLRNLPIPIPQLQQQEKIIKVLDLSSNLIEKQKELLKNYDLFLKSKFIEMFGNPIKNTMKWETAQIKEVIVKVKNDNPLKQPQKKYIYIDIGSINDKYIKHYNCILGENAPSRAKQITIYNDVLVSTVRPNLNAVAIVKSKYESILSSTGFCVLRTNNKNITPYYLFEIVKHKDFIQSLMNVAKGASYPAVSNNDILNLKISIPPLELQNKFASIVERIEIIKEKENQKLKQLEDLHNSLMQKAFKGEIE
ncbi:restriction endonuclease subunit S [Aliarcobacter cryaerophilus]|uniref:restriction endonuclease subunit S n=1 Tax=Aliarcobacter cryaerophilus TaxID=28198 RepID=UPI003DA22F5F